MEVTTDNSSATRQAPVPLSTAKVVPLVFGSGACALVYQVVWQREFTLIFGASTAASAAVLAIFIFGLGAGSLYFGKKSDAYERPMLLYGRLETWIALSAALTPVLLWAIRSAYIWLGGTVVLGTLGGSLLRLFFAGLVLLVPTFCMGGTLPAVVRSVETAQDRGRRNLGLLYGMNTLGAVLGSFGATFVLLEIFGNDRTLFLAALINACIALLATRLGRRQPPATTEPSAAPMATEALARRKAPAVFILTAAAIAGFAFFTMELVWYRMLGPLLGGTVFTFGLILSTVLLGIGAGGAFYSLFSKSKAATLTGFALTCLFEAVFIAIPFALGDDLAVMALHLRDMGNLGFVGLMSGWLSIAMLAIFPPAFISGIQFPMLIGLLGEGEKDVGRHTGLTYGANTGGAIAGSLLGGFVLIPLLSAPGVWRLTVALLVALGAVAIGLSLNRERRLSRVVIPAGAAVVAVLLITAIGPTAVWRHSPIGVGRVNADSISSVNLLKNWQNKQRRAIHWEAEGVESSVALDRSTGFAFTLNGKMDGHARLDAPMQVVSGLLGTVLRDDAKRAMVIGLGTGSTAGWLAAIPSMERVDVAELEPKILDVAVASTPVNHGVMDNPKVNIFIGDAREFLLTAPEKYDVILSEPSNPYRAGIASLFTKEYYEAAAERLSPDGTFIQWVQAYEIDSRTVQLILKTLNAEFPFIEIWRVNHGDMLFIATREKRVYDVAELRERMQTEPYRSAFQDVWRVDSVEGVLARYVAGPAFVERLSQGAPHVNTDDWNLVEFGFAHGIDRDHRFGVNEIRSLSYANGADRPPVENGSVDWRRLEEERINMDVADGVALPELLVPMDEGAQRRSRAKIFYMQGEFETARALWSSQPRPPRGVTELAMLTELAADAGDGRTLGMAAMLETTRPAEAAYARARYFYRKGDFQKATAHLIDSFAAYRKTPWPLPYLMHHGLITAALVGKAHPPSGLELIAALEEPFSVHMLDEERLKTRLDLAMALEEADPVCEEVLSDFEPHTPWNEEVLRFRESCYRRSSPEKHAEALDDLRSYFAAAPVPILPEGVPQ